MSASDDSDEWITARDAYQRLRPSLGRVTHTTICKRASAGLVKARAEVFNRAGQEERNVDIPQAFWWAEGEAALEQNWTTGDFETWIDQRIHLKAFGVTFRKFDIERLVPTPTEPPGVTEGPKKFSNKIFIVHGRDEGPREAVSAFLEKLGLVPVVLNRLPNRGRSVFEKIEANSDVGFAVVLLTPDDEGSLKGEAPHPRARQNVLLELGYFIGLLGRERVCCLQKGLLEVPSDWAGVINERYDDLSPAWKMMLARELKDAGYNIDMNKIS